MGDGQLVIVPALPPQFDAVLHNYPQRFRAYELCKPASEAERAARMLRHGYSGKLMKSGDYSHFLFTNVFGSHAVKPEHFEWETVDGMQCGRWKMTALQELKPAVDAGAAAWKAAKEQIDKQPKEPDVSEEQAAWDEAYQVAEVKYYLMVADLAGVRRAESLTLDRLQMIAVGVRTKARPKDEVIAALIGDRPEGKKAFEVPEELKNDFWEYVKGPLNQFVTQSNVTKKAG